MSRIFPKAVEALVLLFAQIVLMRIIYAAVESDNTDEDMSTAHSATAAAHRVHATMDYRIVQRIIVSRKHHMRRLLIRNIRLDGRCCVQQVSATVVIQQMENFPCVGNAELFHVRNVLSGAQ